MCRKQKGKESYISHLRRRDQFWHIHGFLSTLFSIIFSSFYLSTLPTCDHTVYIIFIPVVT